MRRMTWFEETFAESSGTRPRRPHRAAAAVVRIAAVAGLLLASPQLAHAQVGTVSGVVLVEASLRPIAGAQVAAEGTMSNAITDANGRFRLMGLSGSEVTLQVRMIGYQPETRVARVGEDGVRIELAVRAIALDAVVVTGTAGGQQRRALGNSVATVDAAKVAETAPVKSMQDMINGRAPGVVVMPGTGQVGSGSRIRIRGTSTFSLSSEPLIYVDGVRVNNETGSGISVQAFGSGIVSRLNDFDPDQIESIEILKGPAAATLYGTEAARGVINIITKKGSAGGHRYSASVTQGMNEFANAEDRMPVNYWRDADGDVHALNVTSLREQQGAPLFRTGRTEGYSLNVSGGTAGVRYFVAGDLNRDKGVEVTNFRDQYSGRVNLEIAPSEKFDFGVNSGYVSNETGLSCEAGCGGTMWTAVFSTPANLPENRCGASPVYGCDFWGGFRSGPPEYVHEMGITQNVDRFTGSVRATYRPFSWLSNRLTIGTDVTQEANFEILPYQTSEVNRYFWGETTGNGYHYETRRDQTFNTFDYVGTADVDVTSSLNTSTSLGVQYYTRHIEFIGAQGNEFAGPGLTTIDAAALKPYAGSDYLDNNTLGFYLQEVFGWKDRLFLTGAVRVDNNSAFGSDLDFVTYPKASLAWVLSEEPLLQDRMPDFLNTFKLRLAYGQSGSQPQALSALRTFTPITGPGGTPAVTPSALGNPQLGPERGEEIEAGFDASLLDERVSVEFTYYHTRTKDGILLRPNAPSLGYPGSRWVNAGQLLNTGLETLLRATLIRGDRLDWDMTFSLATNDGEVEELAGGDTTIVNGSYQYRIGYQPNAFFREKVISAEYDATSGRAVNAMCDDGAGGTTPCMNAAGQVVAPRVYLGRSTPALEGSIGTGVRLFERLALNALLDFKSGYKKWDNNYRARCQVFRTCLENMNPAETDPVLLAQLQTSGTLVDFAIQDASFTRLREISLTYDVPEQYLAQTGAHGASITVAARNLAIWTDYTGLDPEATFLSGSPGFMEQSTLPQLRQFVATFNVNF